MLLVNILFVLSFYISALIFSCSCCFIKHTRKCNRLKISILLSLFSLWTIPLLLWVFFSPNSLCYNAFEEYTMPITNPWKCYWCTKPCKNSVVLQPTTILELQTYVVSNEKIRIIGTGHSTNSLYCNNDVLLSLNQMCFIDIPRTVNNITSVKVGSGCQIHYVQKQLSRKGWHLRGFGAISDQQIGGSIMTSLHGMKSFSSFADHVQSITAVLANGQLYKLTKENETLNAWPSSLGTLGIIIDATFEIFPIRVMSCNHTTVGVEDMQNMLINDDYDAFQAVTIYPLRNFYRTKTCKIIEQNWTTLSYLLEDNIDNDKVAIYESFILALTYLFSAIFPKVLASALHDEFVNDADSTELTTEFRTTSYRNPYFDQEYSVPLHECQNTLHTLQEFMGNNQYNIIIRKVKSNSFWMSWAYKKDICAIGTSFIDYGRLDAYTSHLNFRENAEKAIKNMNGSAHTGKLWVSNTSFWKTEQIHKFDQYRRSLDPNEKFQNSYTKQLLSQGVRDDAALPNSLQSRMIVWKTSIWCVWVVTSFLGCFSCAYVRTRHFTDPKDVKISVSNKIDPLNKPTHQSVRQRERAMFIKHNMQGL